MKFVGLAVMDDGVAGVIAALESDHVIGFSGVIIRYFAFAFIAPLSADDRHRLPMIFVIHNLIMITAILRSLE